MLVTYLLPQISLAQKSRLVIIVISLPTLNNG